MLAFPVTLYILNRVPAPNFSLPISSRSFMMLTWYFVRPLFFFRNSIVLTHTHNAHTHTVSLEIFPFNLLLVFFIVISYRPVTPGSFYVSSHSSAVGFPGSTMCECWELPEWVLDPSASYQGCNQGVLSASEFLV